MNESQDRNFDALVVVSPMELGGEPKNQDCASWFQASQIASVADGATSSPYSAKAARISSDYSPALFSGRRSERLQGLADLLFAMRFEAQHLPARLPKDTSLAMRPMLVEAAKVKCKSAYQTTLVAIALSPCEDRVSAEYVCCGDSGLFVFAPSGELLMSSLDAVSPTKRAPVHRVGPQFVFAPGNEVLVNVIGRLDCHARLSALAGIDPRHAANWLICRPIQQHLRRHSRERPDDSRLKWNDLLAVPRYMLGSTPLTQDLNYRVLRFSSVIRRLSHGGSVDGFVDKTSVTAVLPDHFNSASCVRHREQFPSDTSFVLATDGFYGSFIDAREMWRWLVGNSKRLAMSSEREQAMTELHHILAARHGDDDMSFIWLRPRSNKVDHQESHDGDRDY